MAKKTALVTGASAGIGAEFARALAGEGFDVVLVARRRERLETVAEELRRDFQVQAFPVAEDLADPAAPLRIYEELKRQELPIDALINNAGSGIRQTFVSVPWREHAQLIQVQITAAAQLIRMLLPGMLERGFGRIVNVSSLAGLMPGAPTSTLYPAAKSFLIKFSESLAAEVSGTGVHVCAVCPGFTLSEFHDVMGTRGIVSRLPSFMWQDARDVARAGLAAVNRNDTVYVSGAVNQVLAHAVRMLSPQLARAVMRKQAKRYRDVPTQPEGV